MKDEIVGCGLVASSDAYAIALAGSANELILLDLNHSLAQAQAEPTMASGPELPELSKPSMITKAPG